MRQELNKRLVGEKVKKKEETAHLCVLKKFKAPTVDIQID
jgi:hypothetical protein